jgi:hypothetical protein
MSARDRIEGLTNSWYGFGLVAGLVSIFESGFGFFSLLRAAAAVLFSLALTWFFGKRLLAKSSVTRLFLVVVSAICVVTLGLGTARLGWAFLQDWSIALLVQTAFAGSGAWMYLRSLRVLTATEVKAYFD